MTIQNRNEVDVRKISVPVKSLVVISLLLVCALFLTASMEMMLNTSVIPKSAKTDQNEPKITSIVRYSISADTKPEIFYSGIKDDNCLEKQTITMLSTEIKGKTGSFSPTGMKIYISRPVCLRFNH